MEIALKNLVADEKSQNDKKTKKGVEMNLREIKSMSGLKKCLTRIKNSGYSVFRAQNSNTSGISAPERIGDFFISDFIGSARNILNNSACLVSRFELPIPHVLRELIKKGYKKMTNTIIKKINELNKLLGKVYENTDSVSVAMRCSEIRKELAQLSAEIKGNANG